MKSMRGMDEWDGYAGSCIGSGVVVGGVGECTQTLFSPVKSVRGMDEWDE